MVRSGRLELPRPYEHHDLNVACLPIPARALKPHCVSTLIASVKGWFNVRSIATQASMNITSTNDKVQECSFVNAAEYPYALHKPTRV